MTLLIFPPSPPAHRRQPEQRRQGADRGQQRHPQVLDQGEPEADHQLEEGGRKEHQH